VYGLDVFAAGAMLRDARCDLVAVLDVGAYGFTESMPFFLSTRRPWSRREERPSAAHPPRVTLAELLDRQVDPDW